MMLTWHVEFGQLLSGLLAGALAVGGAYGAVLRLYHLLDKRLVQVEQALETHSARMTASEGRLLEVAKELYKLLGRHEAEPAPAAWAGEERRAAAR